MPEPGRKNLPIPQEVHRQIKIEAAKRDIGMADWVAEVMREALIGGVTSCPFCGARSIGGCSHTYYRPPQEMRDSVRSEGTDNNGDSGAYSLHEVRLIDIYRRAVLRAPSITAAIVASLESATLVAEQAPSGVELG